MFLPIIYLPIGVIRSEHKVASETPIQPVFAKGCAGCAEVFPEYAEGLKDLAGFSHVFLIYHLHQAPSQALRVKPFLDDSPKGVFATRAPCRPNPIGMSVVRLVGRIESKLFLQDVDILDETPLLDIKPFIKKFDFLENTCGGWTEKVDEEIAQVRGRRGYKTSIERSTPTVETP